MPKGYPYRPSTLEERKQFYATEFSVQKVKQWFKKNSMPLPQICALDAGTDTGIILDKRYKGQMLYFLFRELKKKIQKYVPEDVYYDRNTYAHPRRILKTLHFTKPLAQELVFDVDADNITCNHHRRHKVCSHCLREAYRATLTICNELSSVFHNVTLVYSGRGFHVHVHDKKAALLTFRTRKQLNKILKKHPIDPWVSGGHIRLMRMPYSLNTLVSRKVVPIQAKRTFSPKAAIPRFLKH